jgi:hypothetical protein
MKNYIYIIKVDESKTRSFIKIGYTNNLKKRLSSIQIGNPRKIELINLLVVKKEEAREVEKTLHRSIETHWLNGEWFTYGQSQKLILEAQITNLQKAGKVALEKIPQKKKTESELMEALDSYFPSRKKANYEKQNIILLNSEQIEKAREVMNKMFGAMEAING